MDNPILPTELVALGGVLWERGPLRRVYFHNISDLLKLPPSIRSQRHRVAMWLHINSGKFWYDCVTHKFHWDFQPRYGFDAGLAVAQLLKRRVLRNRRPLYARTNTGQRTE